MSGETEEAVSGWTTDTLRAHLERLLAARQAADTRRFEDLRTMLDERYATQTKALDAAFKAAEQAVQTALASQEKAVSKAEAAADKRFEAVNEFRQQLADQTSNFPTRLEMSTRLDSITADVNRNTQEIRALELRLTSRLDLMTGGQAGASASRTDQRQNIGALTGIIGAVIAVVAIAVTILIATRGH